MSEKILVTGANGQLGTALVASLIQKFGSNNVFATDIRIPEINTFQVSFLDVLDVKQIEEFVFNNNIKVIYHLAAILSAKGEQNPLQTWDINMQSLLNIFEVSRKLKVSKVFYPSSIAVFGENAPKDPCPQDALCEPSTVYGISKVAGENWASYYFKKYGLDIRSLRYPGVISYQSMPGGGTTDYAVEIYHEVIKSGKYTCFLDKNTTLPMIYIDDAIRATLELMDAPSENIKIRTSYNLAGLSFSPNEIYASIKKYFPDFEIDYKPDYRQKIADSWPQRMDDTRASKDWNWKPKYDLDAMTAEMLKNLEIKLQNQKALV